MSTMPSSDKKRAGWIWWVLLAGLVILAWLILPSLLSAQQLSLTWLVSSKAAWYVTRASGTVGYLLLAASTVWGLVLSAKLVPRVVPPSISLAMHNYLSWMAIGLAILHGLALLFDGFYTYTPADLIVPFIGPYRPFWVGLGVIGFYLMVLTSASFWLRKQLGQKNWRLLHYLTFVAFILVTVHGWIAGTDQVQLRVMYIVSSLLVTYLTAYRGLLAIARRRPGHDPNTSY